MVRTACIVEHSFVIFAYRLGRFYYALGKAVYAARF